MEDRRIDNDECPRPSDCSSVVTDVSVLSGVCDIASPPLSMTKHKDLQ